MNVQERIAALEREMGLRVQEYTDNLATDEDREYALEALFKLLAQELADLSGQPVVVVITR